MANLSPQFGPVNWIILISFLLVTTWIGHLLKGDTKGMRGFFLGDRKIPWWAVAGSLIATRTSALTFIAVPAAIFMAGGNLTYLQMTLGFIAGDMLMAFIFIKAYYKEEIYSPYDYFEKQLNAKVSQLSRILFIIGTIMSQGIRLLSTALILSVITGLSLVSCIFIIALFAVIWTWMGGITTVIWTDVIQFCIFLLGGIFSLLWVFKMVPGGLGEILSIADSKAKLVLIDLSLDPTKTFTLWVGLIGCTVFELGQNAIDQVVAQRIMCCKNEKEAKKAVIFSAIGNVTTFLMAAVGLGLVAFYHLNPLGANAADLIVKQPDRIFPHFIVTNIPNGISGLIIAALFAAGISTLDSALSALSQASISGIYRKHIKTDESEAHYLKAAKLSVLLWGILLSLIALVFHSLMGQGLLKLGLQVPGYVYGALLGIALLALWGKGTWTGIFTGTLMAIGAVIFLKLNSISFFWWYPIACIIVVVVALLMSGPRKE
jgi:SSS family transporter